jgi:hypothetical protein
MCANPEWGGNSNSLAVETVLRREGRRLYIILSAFWQPLDFELAAAYQRQRFMAPMDRHRARTTAGHRPPGRPPHVWPSDA